MPWGAGLWALSPRFGPPPRGTQPASPPAGARGKGGVSPHPGARLRGPAQVATRLTWARPARPPARSPPGTPARARLDHYVRGFDTVEVNSPFYHWPPDRTFAAWRRRLPEGFRLSEGAPGAEPRPPHPRRHGPHVAAPAPGGTGLAYPHC